MINHITLHGYLGRDPEIKEYSNDKGEGSLANFSLAVKRNVGDDTDWFNCTAFGNQAKTIEKFFRKGSQIMIEGRMQSDRFTSKDGIEKTAWKVIVERFDFCDPKKKDEGPTPDFTDVSDVDIPF